MKEVFVKRRFDFNQQCLKYLRYVLNDHFVLVLIFLLGFILYQYSNLLKHFPRNHWPIIAGLAVVSLVLLWLGRVATYLEPADQVFLLTQETGLIAQIKRARWRNFLVWGSFQTLFLLILAPLFLALGLSKLGFVTLLVLMLVAKGTLVLFKSRKLLVAGNLNWEEALAQEQGRKQAILKFYSLFTNVKGISSQTKRRAYLDFLLVALAKKQSKLWSNLYLRAYLRSGDYLALTLRLLLLSLLSLVFVKAGLVALALTLLFNYLLLFQLLALTKHYDYQYLTQLFPLGSDLRKINLKQVLRGILYGLVLLEGIFLLIFAFSWQNLGLLLGISLLLVEVYLPYKLNKLFA
ncbi:ABC transporter permease [Streptococcus criceti]|uniref:ABC transporter, permease protein n=1 Tax=Streptococcus criceti HS-6 TaxID=873449 RepID=G5JMU4_STRCG|nr:ABC transporter permease [Streptococcus criceti]EHI74445.1 ABC transporter, permease protein [Streptococcus criceti HS-6]SUN41574.1 ABC transporter permease [Streptococcus criceti]